MARFDLTDFEWSVIEPLLPTKVRGMPRADDRKVLNGIFWRGVSEILYPGRVELHWIMKRSSNMMANWDLACVHSRGGIFHSAAASRKTR